MAHMTLTHTKVTSTATTSVPCVTYNQDRKYLLLQNTSDTVMYLKFGAAAVSAEGIYLAIGQTLELKDDVPYDALFMICAASGKILLVSVGT